MDVLLRQLRQGRDGAVEYQDTELVAENLSVGSAADCTIQLLGEGVAANHALIRGGASALTIAARRGCRMSINGAPAQSATLKIGDLIEIAGHRLRWVAAPAGFDCAIEIEANSQVAASAYERAFRTDLSATWLSKRAAAWVLALLVPLVALVIPYSSIHTQRAGHAPPALLPSDQLWSAGPLIPAHELAAGKRCSTCHQQIFQHVRDSACRQCHESIGDHVEPSRLALTHLGPTQRCSECHREHHAPASGLVVRDDHLCIDCHAKSNTEFGSLKVTAVTGFSSAAHPAFTVSLLKPSATTDAAGSTNWSVSREPIGTAREQSNLKFSHSQHLDATRVTRASDSNALGCSDCHVLDADGEHFVPVTMQRSCISCHELTFDPDAPDRQLPHGRPHDAVLLIQDYFARKAVDPSPVAVGIARRRLPDQQIQEVVCNAATLSCARQRAQSEIESQFKVRGCASCHNVTDTHNADIAERFVVQPVRLTRDYFANVRFSHRTHAVQNNKAGDAACLSCHAVKQSTSSTDLFIPDLPKCLECHSEHLATDRVTLQCSSCHTYHPKTIIARTREGDVQ
jgi:predicted CXXCH cytochrome family protein